jgi:hypothetical protein
MRIEDRRTIMRVARFLVDREMMKYRVRGEHWREGMDVLIKDLPDSTVERIAIENQKKWWRWIVSDEPEFHRPRRARDVIVEEAEYRGILNGYQKMWLEMAAGATGELVANLMLYGDACNTRGRHEMVRQASAGVWTCLDCHRKVTDEEIADRSALFLAGRLGGLRLAK